MMNPLSSTQLLRIWEAGLDQPLLEKTIRLLGEAYHVDDYASIARLSIGDRDAKLLLLREWMFGKKLLNMSACPACKEKIEWETNVEELHFQQITKDLSIRTFNLQQDGYTVQFRLPDSNDITKALKDPSKNNTLLDCILHASFNDAEIKATELPESITKMMELRMSEEDPQADISIQINCPSCKHQWETKFDIVSFLWAEINNWAHRMLQEIYILAKGFGWSESEILNMSARRRSLYLQMLGA